MRMGPAINLLFHFLQSMILPLYCSMMLVYLLSCRREMVKQRWNVGGNREKACTTLAWLYLWRAVWRTHRVITRCVTDTARYHVVRDTTMSASQIARDHRSGCAILLLPSTLPVRGGPRDITRFEISRCPPHRLLGTTGRDVPFYYSQSHCVTDIVRSCTYQFSQCGACLLSISCNIPSLLHHLSPTT